MPNFKELNLNPKILSALESKNYTKPTPIQAQAIPHLLAGKDLLGIAQTGTGKTAAFSLPILDNLYNSNQQVRFNNIRTLILTPTRELASQIDDNIARYSHGLGLKHEVIFGGVNINSQIKAVRKGIDIVVATPGRLLDLMNQGHVRFSQIEILVLDEADRMLDMGFIHDIKKIIARLPEKRQTMFFSATMPDNIAKLAGAILTNPVKVEITPQSTTVEKINQSINYVQRGNKPALLKSILNKEEVKTALIFSRTKHGANKIVNFLEKESISSVAIHGNKSQAAREKALDSFRTGEIGVLVATDIAARGIDVPNITHVINYDLPDDPESYVHRIGRTARAGKNGIAITLCDDSERKSLRAVEKAINYKIPVDHEHPMSGVKAKESSANYPKSNKPQGSKDGKPQGNQRRFGGMGKGNAKSSVRTSKSKKFWVKKND